MGKTFGIKSATVIMGQYPSDLEKMLQREMEKVPKSDGSSESELETVLRIQYDSAAEFQSIWHPDILMSKYLKNLIAIKFGK